MMLSSSGRHGRAVLVLAAAVLVSSAPVRADTPLVPDAVSGIGEAAPALPVVTTPAMRAEATDKLEAMADLYEHIGEGEASYYGYELAGNRTASGERFNPHGLTAAHRTLPLGSKLRVTNKRNGKSVIVRVNDRGPFAHRRVLDLSLAAAKEIDMYRAGKAQVSMELLR